MHEGWPRTHGARNPSPRAAGPGAPAHRGGDEPPLADLQRLAGNSATAGVIQRQSPTREQNIASLKSELTAAAADDTKWKDVALRLNGFATADLPNIAKLIPDDSLQQARSAVERHLAGWPSRRSILAALDARARTRKVKVRPTGQSIWAAYSNVGYNKWHGEDQKNNVWEFIGGSVGRKYVNGQTCAARVSWALNEAGYPVGRGEPNDPKVTYKGVRGDGRYYIVWVPTMQAWLTSAWGPPDMIINSPEEARDVEATLKDGEVVVFAGPHHSGLIMKGYSDGYVKSSAGVMPVVGWTLP